MEDGSRWQTYAVPRVCSKTNPKLPVNNTSLTRKW